MVDEFIKEVEKFSKVPKEKVDAFFNYMDQERLGMVDMKQFVKIF